MGMDSWVIGQIAFWYTVHEVKPSAIVDKAIALWIDIVTPGRGTGESHWWMRTLRSIEQSSERTTRELEIRRDLRTWDNEHAEIHHELIVRWVCGAAVSILATSLYNSLRRDNARSSSRNYR